MDYTTLFHISFWIGFAVAALIALTVGGIALFLFLKGALKEDKNLMKELAELEEHDNE